MQQQRVNFTYLFRAPTLEATTHD